MRLLVVEDPKIRCDSLVLVLRKARYAVDTAANVEEGLWAAVGVNYDLLIVEAALSTKFDLELVREARKRKLSVPILVLAALGTVRDRVLALDLGADDYMVKPFDFDELLARVRALLRRRYAHTASAIAISGLMINTAAKRVSRDGLDIALRRREYLLLEYLAFRRGELVSVREIEEHLYDDGVNLSSNSIESSISMLRKAIDQPSGASLIRTRRGLGYMLAPQ